MKEPLTRNYGTLRNKGYKIAVTGPTAGGGFCDFDTHRYELAEDLMTAYNATHAAGINPAAVKGMAEALARILRADNRALIWAIANEALKLAKEGA